MLLFLALRNQLLLVLTSSLEFCFCNCLAIVGYSVVDTVWNFFMSRRNLKGSDAFFITLIPTLAAPFSLMNSTQSVYLISVTR